MKMQHKEYHNWIAIIFTFFLVYFSQDVLVFSTNANRKMWMVKNIVLIGLIGALALRIIFKRKGIQITLLKYLVLISGFIGVTALTDTASMDKYLYNVIVILLGIVFVNNFELNEFIEAYKKVMFFLSCYSIILTIMYLLAYRVLCLLPVVTNTNGFRFYNAILGNVMTKTEYIGFRNFSIFREPGVYAIFLVLNLLFIMNSKITSLVS